MPLTPSASALVASLFATGASIVALVTARAALRRAGVRSGDRAARQPGLALEVVDGEARRTVADDRREYALRLMGVNGGGKTETLAAATLRVTYRTRANFLGAVDIPPQTSVTPADGRALMLLPLDVGPGRALDGWLVFRTTNVIPRHCRVQDHALIVTSADGRRHIVDASLPQVLAGDSDGAGPATWGWD